MGRPRLSRHARRPRNRWRDWIAFGALLGLSFLTKYFVLVLLVALLVAAIMVPAYRKVFVNIKLYAAGLLALLIVVPYLVAVGSAPGGAHLRLGVLSAQQQPRLQALINFIHPVLLVLLPIGIAAIWLYPARLDQDRRLRRERACPISSDRRGRLRDHRGRADPDRPRL